MDLKPRLQRIQDLRSEIREDDFAGLEVVARRASRGESVEVALLEIVRDFNYRHTALFDQAIEEGRKLGEELHENLRT